MRKSLMALAFGTFGLGVSEFVMMGILPLLAKDFGVSIPTAGHLISSYALGVCVGAPLIVLVARAWRLKRILLFLMGIYTLAALAMALAPNYHVMLVMRFLAGMPHGAYFGVGAIVADRLSREGKSCGEFDRHTVRDYACIRIFMENDFRFLFSVGNPDSVVNHEVDSGTGTVAEHQSS